MYSLIISVKNKENPYYKAVLESKTESLLGSLNSFFGNDTFGKMSLGLEEDVGNQISSLFSLAGFDEKINVQELFKMTKEFEKNLTEKFGITEYFYQLELTKND